MPILKQFRVKLKQRPSTAIQVPSHVSKLIDIESENPQIKPVSKGSPKWKDRIGSVSEMERVSLLANQAMQHLAMPHSHST